MSFTSSTQSSSRSPTSAAQLREHGRLRVLDVGCAGPQPLELWEPFRPYFDRLELVGVDKPQGMTGTSLIED